MADQTGGYAAGWYADPQGRFDHRYYDGSQWTQHVQHRGVATVDVPVAAVAAPWSPHRQGYTEIPRYEHRNAMGTGFVIGLVGLILVVGSCFLPWIDGFTLFDLPSSEFASPNTTANLNLQVQVIWLFYFALMLILGTTLRYQGGKLYGFFAGGLIGLAVCWRRIDRDDRSLRVNAMFMFFVPFQVLVLWFYIAQVRDNWNFDNPPINVGVWMMLAGWAVLFVAALVGRGHKRVRIG